MISFSLVYAPYNLNRKTDLVEDLTIHPERTKVVKRIMPHLNWTSILLVIVSFLLALKGGVGPTLLYIGLVAWATVYSLRWIPKSWFGFRSPREIPLIKSFFPSFGWAILGAVFPAVYVGALVSAAVGVMLLFVFLRLLINTNVFDTRDMKGDRKQGLKTIPVVFGPTATRNFLLVLNTLSAILIFYAAASGILPPVAHVVNLVAIYGYYFIIKAFDQKADMDFVCDVVFDGEAMVWLLLLLAGTLASSWGLL